MLKTAHKIIRTKLNHIGYIYKLNLGITYRCNSRCTTCNIWKMGPVPEMSLSDFEKLFKANGVEWLSLTGGEPFLREDIDRIIELATKYSKTKFINIPCNGLLPDRIIAKTEEILKNKDLARLGVSVSIDGLAEVNNRVRGVLGGWERSMNTLIKLLELQKVHKNLDVMLGCTVSPYNIGDVRELILYINKNKILPLNDIHFSFYHISQNYYGNNNDIEAVQTKNQEAYKIKVTSLIDYLHQSAGVPRHPMKLLDRKYRELFKEFQKNGKSPIPCKALISSLFIDPRGDIYPCISFNQRLGNIRDFNYSLKTVQVMSQDVIKKISQGKCPGCWISCEAAQSMISSLNPWKTFI